jgi:flagellar hook assembly protein FlgD
METRRFTFLAVSAIMFFCFRSSAQSITPIASGLVNPIGITENSKGDIWVNEAGTGNNDSKVLLIKSNGKVYTVIDSLPSYKDPVTGEVSGTWRSIELPKNKLLVISGGGISPYAASILFFNLHGFVLGVDSPETLANVDSIIRIGDFLRNNGYTDTDPYDLTFDPAGNMFIADAGADAVVEVTANQQFSVVKHFAPIPNIYTPFPDSIGPVPTGIEYNPETGGFYLSFLTGFPFLSGISSVININATGDTSKFAGGLTQAVDIQRDSATGNLYVLQFSNYDTSANPIPNTSKIIRITPDGTESVAAEGFGPAAGMVLDSTGQGAYVTSLFTGEVLHISGFVSGISSIQNTSGAGLLAFPNPFHASTNIQFQLKQNSDVQLSILDLTGKELFAVNEGILTAGSHNFSWNGTNSSGKTLPAGTYIVQLKTDQGIENSKIILN